MPFSRQEFALWLQHGGLRIVLIVAGITGAVIIFLLLWRGGRPLPLATTPEPVASIPTLFPSLPSVTPAISPTESIAPQGVGGTGTTEGGARFQVTGTGTEGLFLRPDHSAASPPIKTLQEGVIVTIIGEDFSGPDRVWKHIRDPEGTEGWAAAEYLKPAP